MGRQTLHFVNLPADDAYTTIHVYINYSVIIHVVYSTDDGRDWIGLDKISRAPAEILGAGAPLIALTVPASMVERDR